MKAKKSKKVVTPVVPTNWNARLASRLELLSQMTGDWVPQFIVLRQAKMVAEAYKHVRAHAGMVRLLRDIYAE